MSDKPSDATAVFVIEGTRYPLDLARLDLGDWSTFKRMTNGEVYNLETLDVVLNREDPDAIAALILIAMRKTNPNASEEYVRSLTGDKITAEQADPSQSSGQPAAADDSLGGADVVPLHSRETDDISGSRSTPANTASTPGTSTSQALLSG